MERKGDAKKTVGLNAAKASLSALVDETLKGKFVTITRHGKPVAALVPIEAAEIARKAIARKRCGLAAYLGKFPGGELERNHAPSRDIDH